MLVKKKKFENKTTRKYYWRKTKEKVYVKEDMRRVVVHERDIKVRRYLTLLKQSPTKTIKITGVTKTRVNRK